MYNCGWHPLWISGVWSANRSSYLVHLNLTVPRTSENTSLLFVLVKHNLYIGLLSLKEVPGWQFTKHARIHQTNTEIVPTGIRRAPHNSWPSRPSLFLSASRQQLRVLFQKVHFLVMSLARTEAKVREGEREVESAQKLQIILSCNGFEGKHRQISMLQIRVLCITCCT